MDSNSTSSSPMASSELLSALEECRVSPPVGTVGEKSLPLTFSDMGWMHFQLVKNIFFYKFPHSKSHFVETTIPSLKRSLPLVLKHYYPLAGNLVFPPNLVQPEIHYKDGDWVSLIFAASDEDVEYLIKTHQREVSRFHPLVPQMPPVSVQLRTLVVPVFAIQVTLFPNSGISFGFTLNHVAADGNTFIRFIKSWAIIHKSQTQPMVPESAVLPFYNRTSILKQTYTLSSIYWQHQQKTKFEGYQPLLPTSNVLATFLLTEAHLGRLKKRILVQCPTSLHVSSFTVACAYTWVCLVKARACSGEEASGDELEHFRLAADCRAHMGPPLPENYFGNCVVTCAVAAKTKQLVDKDGFVIAASLIGEAIRERLRSEKGVLHGLEKFLQYRSTISRERVVGVAGLLKFAVYDIDFGMGQLQKWESISIDETRSISLNEGKDNKSDIEIGVSLPNIKMDAFASIFVTSQELGRL